jgi:hypothetical protein
MEKGVLHNELLNQSFVGGSNSEHRADGGRHHNMTKSLIIVNPRALRETPEDPSSLVAIERPIGEELMCEDLLISDDVGATGSGNKFS